MLLPNLCMQWAIADLSDVTVDSTIVATLIHPRPEVFVLGTGPTTIPPLKDSDWYRDGDEFKNLSDFRDLLNEQGTQLEILDSVSLSSTRTFFSLYKKKETHYTHYQKFNYRSMHVQHLIF